MFRRAEKIRDYEKPRRVAEAKQPKKQGTCGEKQGGGEGGGAWESVLNTPKESDNSLLTETMSAYG